MALDTLRTAYGAGRRRMAVPRRAAPRRILSSVSHLTLADACPSQPHTEDGLRRVPEEYPMESFSCVIFPLNGEERPTFAV